MQQCLKEALEAQGSDSHRVFGFFLEPLNISVTSNPRL